MKNFKELKVIDPVKKQAEKRLEDQEYSPMDPPDAYTPPNLESVPYEEMHPFLRSLADEHKTIIKELEVFEQSLNSIQEEGVTKKSFEKISDFFRFFDAIIMKHTRREEKLFYQLLRKRLLENGQHSTGEEPISSVDMLEDEHLKANQQAAIVFNFLGMASRLPDQASQLVMLDAGLEQGKALIELLRLHIFREEHIAFTQAHQYITKAEFDNMLTV